ncbi:hypothetical protein [Methylobacterium sp. WL103]|uniref:hypothetical protein n=1 Tax=Methylobacterium sp. WL103 TaxID=2603891 RepID=UPI00164F7C43|nr:hypothetical protein [Methylobacterium sp. WL103]
MRLMLRVAATGTRRRVEACPFRAIGTEAAMGEDLVVFGLSALTFVGFVFGYATSQA